MSLLCQIVNHFVRPLRARFYIFLDRILQSWTIFHHFSILFISISLDKLTICLDADKDQTFFGSGEKYQIYNQGTFNSDSYLMSGED